MLGRTKISIAAKERIELNELDARFEASDAWGESYPYSKVVHVAEENADALIEKLKHHLSVLSINGKPVKHEAAPTAEPAKISENNAGTLFSPEQVRINITMSQHIKLSEIDPRVRVGFKVTHGFPMTASFQIEKALAAEFIEKLKQDKRVFSVNGEDTTAGIAYREAFNSTFKFTQVK